MFERKENVAPNIVVIMASGIKSCYMIQVNN